MTRWLWPGALLSVLSGCTVSAEDVGGDPRPSNTCGSDSECGSGICRAGVCQDPNGKLEALLLELTPPSNSPLPHLSLVQHVDDVPTGGGEKFLVMARPVHVTGSLTIVQEESDCYPTLPQDGERPLPTAADGSLPVTVTLAPRERLLGLPQQFYVTSAKGSDKDFSYRFELQVPAGEYDVYVAPPRGQTGCVVPPQLYRAQPIPPPDTAGRLNDEVLLAPEVVVQSQVTLETVCDPSSMFENAICLRIKWPKANPTLDGWLADIIEPLGGKAISTEFTLGNALHDPEDKSSTVEYAVPLIYSKVIDGPAQKVEEEPHLVRLRPPAGVIAPTILLDRAALGLSDKYSAVLDDFTELPAPVRVEGQLTRRSDGKPVEGSVTLVSSQIFGVNAGIFPSFQTTVGVEADGIFQVDLPPGSYRVHAVPPTGDYAGSEGSALAALVSDWEVPADVRFQAGKLLELPAIPSIVGQSSFPGAQVEVQAAPQKVSPFDVAFGEAAFVPRANSALVDERGRFQVQVDPGSFDISVRAPEKLGFAWFVRPSVQVQDTDLDLGRVQAQPPSVVTGTASVAVDSTSAVAVPSALLRAYAYLDEDRAYTRDPSRAVSVIQVAETRTDEQGAFRLLLPSSIAAPK